MFVSRRHFLKNAAGGAGLWAFSALVPGFLSRTAAAASAGATRGKDAPCLVVIQLSGGNDGLNTVIPYGDDAYQRARPTLRFTGSQALKIDPKRGLGFHPEMAALHRLYHEGQVRVVQGVGYPNSNRNHESAMRDWHTATPKDTVLQTGWVGRAIDQMCTANQGNLPGMFVGHIRPPLGMHAERTVVPTLKSMEQWAASPGDNETGKDALRRGLLSASARAAEHPPDPLLDFLQEQTRIACAASERVKAEWLATGSRHPTDYPPTRLAHTMGSIAQLVRAELGVRLFYAELGGGGIGGFDTHAGQAANHGALLRELSEALGALAHDLSRDKLWDRVIVITFSEFGRTLTENGRHGTNHGAAAPMILAGGGLKGGLTGDHPSLTTLDQDAPRHHTDFRQVYATLLEQWLGCPSQSILGGEFTLLPGLLG